MADRAEIGAKLKTSGSAQHNVPGMPHSTQNARLCVVALRLYVEIPLSRYSRRKEAHKKRMSKAISALVLRSCLVVCGGQDVETKRISWQKAETKSASSKKKRLL